MPKSVLVVDDEPMVVMFMVSNLLHFSFGAWLLDHRSRILLANSSRHQRCRSHTYANGN